ncbi:hypothetical protein [Streptomyces sp. NPDC088400]|uniref:hypothetical protein n=1 Tax=Streptomyces sp. NPDC088400 TaxID=3365861 RepID=UPI00380C1773
MTTNGSANGSVDGREGASSGGSGVVFEPGSYAVDSRTGRVGRVMSQDGVCVQLRPPGGGVEWDCPSESVSPARPGDVLRARVTELNHERRLP